MRKWWVIDVLAILGLTAALGILVHEIIYGGAWYIAPLELGLVAGLCITLSICWKSTLVKVLSITLFFGALMIMMIEIETMQPLFTKDFLVAELLILINLVVVVLLVEWVTRKEPTTTLLIEVQSLE